MSDSDYESSDTDTSPRLLQRAQKVFAKNQCEKIPRAV